MTVPSVYGTVEISESGRSQRTVRVRVFVGGAEATGKLIHVGSEAEQEATVWRVLDAFRLLGIRSDRVE